MHVSNLFYCDHLTQMPRAGAGVRRGHRPPIIDGPEIEINCSDRFGAARMMRSHAIGSARGGHGERQFDSSQASE